MSLEGRNLPGATSLIEDLDRKVLVVLRDGRHVAGRLTSLDQYSNVVLEDAHEREYAGSMMFENPQGLMIIRSDNIVLVAQIDEAKESQGPIKAVDKASLDAEAERLEEANVGVEPITLTDQSLWDFDS